jgi:hypothetical protein
MDMNVPADFERLPEFRMLVGKLREAESKEPGAKPKDG